MAINNSTVIKEFSANYYLFKPEGVCGYTNENRFCILVKWDDFIMNPNEYIQQAFDKREANIAKRTIVYPK